MYDWPTAAPEELVKLVDCRNSRKELGNSKKELHAYKTITPYDSLILTS